MTRRLEVRLLNYFTLIVLAAGIIAIEFYIEINNLDVLNNICNAVPVEQGQTDAHALLNLRNKIAIMLGILTLVVAIIMLMFIKNISLPLRKISDAAQKINDGDLTQIIPIESHDEIGLVGTAINELTSNLQEVAALTASTAQQSLINIQHIEQQALLNQPPSTDDINELRQQMEVLISFVDSFQLLQTDIKS